MLSFPLRTRLVGCASLELVGVLVNRIIDELELEAGQGLDL